MLLQLIQNDYTTSPLAKSTAYTDQVYDINSRKDDAHNIAKPLSQCSPIDGFGEQKHDGVIFFLNLNLYLSIIYFEELN